MRPTEKSRIQLPTNLRIELFCVLHVSQNEPLALITFLDLASLDRLRTIISYDRICVLDAGQIAVSFEFLFNWLIRFQTAVLTRCVVLGI